MRLHSWIAVTLIALLATITHAQGNMIRPDKCPELSAMIAVPFTQVETFHSEGRWMTENKNTFGSDREWLFFVQDFTAMNEQVALDKANRALPTLQYENNDD